ncbi:SGNH/GDSL hydrolase family protein [Niabella ginsengisoli]|uniref:SGNH/GDSL hydrolase family protein n=1 Tax=Niabella ginsengisoli TaxID=522298 RepID=A0ABS9SJA2_9BACT|nr:SGNH/GDSL hydrolase family protein [Niabella ginsengisoli]MCH5598406.1 SGNH/GDSL hydrolase family protein [Niabella ginsengisoli]
MAGKNAFSQKWNEELIRASQEAAPAMMFLPDTIPRLLNVERFYDQRECIVRNGLTRIISLMEAGKPVRIAYIGGSITQGAYCYRQQSATFLAKRYFKSSITFFNAGVSGTGTDLGACRIGEQVLTQKPDLIFIEFAVNGAYAPGMEGMIRQIIKNNPLTDICLIYTVMTGQLDKYAQGSMPDNVRNLEAIADHYGLPSVHLGLWPAKLKSNGKLLWKGTKDVSTRILFSNDGIHPLPEGGDLYAEAIARAFIKLEKAKLPVVKKQLKTPLLPDSWEDAGMYAPEDIATFDGRWEKIVPEKNQLFINTVRGFHIS